MQRRLAAIMVADIVGYSSLMEQAEERTAARVAACQDLIQQQVAALDGRVFNTAGDASFVEFASPINALRCATEIRTALAGTGDGEPLRLRFGLHLADVVIRGEDLVGDGVNVAARIQQDAEPDTICVSGVFFDNIRRNSPFHFDDLGDRNFKNMAEPIHIYRLRGEMASHRMQSAPTRTKAVGEKRPSSVAVLPFRVTGGDEDQRFLAEGLTGRIDRRAGALSPPVRQLAQRQFRGAGRKSGSGAHRRRAAGALRAGGADQEDRRPDPYRPHPHGNRERFRGVEQQDRAALRGTARSRRCDGVADRSLGVRPHGGCGHDRGAASAAREHERVRMPPARHGPPPARRRAGGEFPRGDPMVQPRHRTGARLRHRLCVAGLRLRRPARFQFGGQRARYPPRARTRPLGRGGEPRSWRCSNSSRTISSARRR